MRTVWEMTEMEGGPSVAPKGDTETALTFDPFSASASHGGGIVLIYRLTPLW